MSAEYPVGTVARVRVGEWEGRAGRDMDRAGNYWALLGHPSTPYANDSDVTVLDVELPALVAEPKAFGARVKAEWDGERDLFVRTGHELGPWLNRHGCRFAWSRLTNPVVLHDPEVDR